MNLNRRSGGVVTRWIYGPATDSLMAWSWLPIFAVAAGFSSTKSAEADSVVVAILGWVFLVSLLHQPLTLLLVYADPSQFTRRRLLFVLAPVVGIALVAVAVFFNLWVIVPIAALWQVFHTQQQRYGILRIYGRKSGYGTVRLDRLITYAPLIATIVAVAVLPVTSAQIVRFASTLGGNNAAAVGGLLQVSGVLVWLLVPAIGVSILSVVLYVRQELTRPRGATEPSANPAKWNYLASNLALLAALLINPVAGLASFIAAHAIEYVVVVHRTLVSRYANGTGAQRGLLAALSATRLRRTILLAGFFALFAIVDLQLRGVLPASAYLIIVYTIGLLHFVYDAVIWKSRQPRVAADFGIPDLDASAGQALPRTNHR